MGVASLTAIFTGLAARMQTSDTAAAEQAAALEGVVPELERLGRLLAGERVRQVEAMRDFAHDPALSQLMELHRKDEAQLDLFRVLGIKDSELAHSNFLAWLLDPQQSHGLGTYFLKSLLLQTCGRASTLELPAIKPTLIHGIDWSTTEVRREWQYIDILVLNREARFVCAIETRYGQMKASEPTAKANSLGTGKHCKSVSGTSLSTTSFCHRAGYARRNRRNGNTGHQRTTPPSWN